MGWVVGGGCESASDQGAGAKRRLGPGGGLVLWGSRALEWSIGKTRQGLDGGTEETGSVGRQTASRAWDGTAQSLERRYMVRGSVCCLALTLRRSLRPVYPDFVCASSRNGCLPAARNTSDGVYPGRGVEE